jgi:hypothetical protein
MLGCWRNDSQAYKLTAMEGAFGRNGNNGSGRMLPNQKIFGARPKNQSARGSVQAVIAMLQE